LPSTRDCSRGPGGHLAGTRARAVASGPGEPSSQWQRERVCAMRLPWLLDNGAPPRSRIRALAHRGPVGHLAGTAARAVRRVRRNVASVLPIPSRTRTSFNGAVDNFRFNRPSARRSGDAGQVSVEIADACSQTRTSWPVFDHRDRAQPYDLNVLLDRVRTPCPPEGPVKR
jgi:hypothetical protein